MGLVNRKTGSGIAVGFNIHERNAVGPNVTVDIFAFRSIRSSLPKQTFKGAFTLAI